ncbi:proline-rich protein 11 [Grus americana]|uniref:proline-rich protein 11 n=1 Tax=Grus americana TaxID=9117 RepID=UPI002407D0FD|nr:proline-rich protein 11 [Grus americana]XP_054703780.1 proline-rich protein 11 [Grus americana]XP_054703781.1 proline-rich protein 11 [Grus americana]XP_054703782.1 proline-rich protein 11 [Grus americana]
MAKYKKHRRKQRARAKFLLKKKGDATAPPSSGCPPPRSTGDFPPHTSSVPSHLSSLWSLALPSVKNVVKPFTTTASFLYCWCQNTFAQSFKVVKDTIFPSQIYLRELNTFKEQLEKLETEFSRLQGTLQMNGIAALSSENSLCQRCNKPVLGAPVQMQMAPASSVSRPSAMQLQPVSAPPPPPPPPPPPLPPPKLPPAPLLLKRGNGSKALLAPSLKKDAPMQITLKDLLNVKLKKTDSSLGMDKAEPPVKTRGALITVSDLQSISLRPKSKPSTHVTNSLITPPKNQLDLRKHLKKVNIQRSPGGTPLNSKENMECGTGLTPIMTQALRRKFQMAHPKSPSPARLSAANSFDEQK